MKDLLKMKILFTFLALSLGLFSCSDEDPGLDLETVQQVESSMKSGTWKITKFIDSGKDETHHFNGFTFIFDNSGIVTSTNGDITYEGTWSITDSSSNDDSPDDMDFNIHFNLVNDFEDLNDDWDFISSSGTKIELIDVSGGNGGTDYLTFEII
jgi:hypothetical protein